MKKTVFALLLACVLFAGAGCSSPSQPAVDMISGSQTLELSSQSTEESPYEPEFPPADSSSQETSGGESSGSSASSSQGESGSSQSAPSSSQEASSSSEAPPSSQESSSQPQAESQGSGEQTSSRPAPAEESRAVWLSYLEFDKIGRAHV